MIIMKKARKLIAEIEGYYDLISQAALVFKAGIYDHLNGKEEQLEERVKELAALEHDADVSRREIKHKLYAEMLIPDSRGDVLGLLEASDNVIDRAKSVLSSFAIEKPEIPEFLHDDFRELTDTTVNAMDEMVKASRSFFHELGMINDYINKVYFYEHEVDKIEERIKRTLFTSDKITLLSHRVQMRYFTERIAQVSDDAESVCERLEISAIKRSI